MKHLKIAYSFDVQYYFVDSDRDIVPIEETDFTDVAVAVLSDQDFDYIDAIEETGFGIPIMVIMPGGEKLPQSYIDKVDVVFTEEMVNKSRCIAAAERLAGRYEQTVLPPFFADLVDYVSEKNTPFDCPGHQDGLFFKKHPAGRYLYDFYGPHIFQSGSHFFVSFCRISTLSPLRMRLVVRTAHILPHMEQLCLSEAGTLS